MNIIKINYITKIETLDPLFKNFFNNIPYKIHHLYYEKKIMEYIQNTISNEIILFNEKNIREANYLLNKYLSNNLSNNLNNNENINTWNICITKNNFMFDFPFTLGSIIFLPISYIISCDKESKNNEYITTLIHEKIHIYQRYNLNIWNKYIEKYSNWKKININYLLNSDNIIYNPDTLYINNQYLYIIDNILYFGYLNKELKTEWINIDNKEIITNKLLPEYEHPFEELAYKISNDLINKKI